MLIEKTHTMCPQEEHDSCFCAADAWLDKAVGMLTEAILRAADEIALE